MEPQNRVQWVYEAKDNEDLTGRYDEWGAEYDRDMEDGLGYVGPRDTAELFARYVSKDARVLDAGAGTGLVGRELRRLGFNDLVAIDMSEGMLEEARAKGVYGAMHLMVLGERLDFPSNSFGGTICVGVLTLGHAPARSIEEFVRVTQPGGHVVFSIRPDIYESHGFKDVQEALVASGSCKLIEVTAPSVSSVRGDREVLHQIWAYQVTSE
ncbi:MAG: class I SAM-dependent methyltransferase [SAR202 cluster bacterium]|nr:SAM-dependent methyltransferase [Chloroflexota bacterium]MDP6422993.1 class I SAM-dependent methyltransferase [SAR202 cluster bacterium]HAL49076.1 class I SAM-dependent methyltransferase [Dehalococcoidia bacterium]MDP6800324.1 class I SAM-dependent methyltransferase [SAR202 cluster bacterium]MQG56512.1 class I SAM-dependent methyltransferase [SAR202 cluster bacterium]